MVQNIRGDRAYRNLIVEVVRPCSRIHQLNRNRLSKQVGKVSGTFIRIRNGGNLSVLGGAEPCPLVATEIK